MSAEKSAERLYIINRRQILRRNWQSLRKIMY
jgi:hypothetical protein